MAYVDNSGTRIYYESFGAGEPLLLIMGLGGTTHGWGMQIPVLAPHYRVIALDNRGVGRSDKPDRPYSIEAFADDAAAVLAAAGVSGPAHVLGASMGGLIAQELYHRHPQRVASLTLACSGVGLTDPKAVPADAEVGRVLLQNREDQDPRQRLEAMIELFYHPQYRTRVPDLVERLLKFHEQLPQPAYAYRRQLEACFTHRPLSPRLAAIAVPTLILHGADDRIWPVANAERLAEGIAEARLTVIPDSGHLFMVEKPQAFNRAVLEFLSDVDRGRGRR